MPFSHVRLRFWDDERYTEAQAAELRQLRALYTTHLVPVFGAPLPDAFALRTEDDFYYPRYTARTLTPPPITPVPPGQDLPTQPYRNYASTIIVTVATFEEGRNARWLGKGHPNDPTRLLGIFLRNLCQTWLSTAASNATTLRQVTALRQYLEALAREEVFTAEDQGQESITVLVHNLATPLSFLEKRLRYEISLQSAREHFAEVKEGVANILSEAAQFLFYALAAKDRTKLPFSLVNLHARVVHKELSQALQSREGLLLKAWAYAKGVTQSVLPQDAKAAHPLSHPVIRLLKGASDTPLLDEKGCAHPAWQGFLKEDPEWCEMLSPDFKKLPSGLCPLLLETEQESVPNLAIQVHGLLEILSQYQTYLQKCWELAGFGGDTYVYDQISEAVTSILGELLIFNDVLSGRLTAFQEHLDQAYKKALDTQTHVEWRRNYRVAKAAQEKLLGMLQGCDRALAQMIRHAQDPALRAMRRTMAQSACTKLHSVPSFLNQTRQQLGLSPEVSYPGLERLKASQGEGTFRLPLPDILQLDQVWTLLCPAFPKTAARLNALCADAPTSPPWQLFWGSYQRYTYLQDTESLKTIGRDLSSLQLNAQTPMTLEKAAFMRGILVRLRVEQRRVHDLRQELMWPFHRASRSFFHYAWEAMEAAAQQLNEDLSVPVIESESVDSSDSTRVMHSALVVTREEKATHHLSVLIDRALSYEMLAPEDKKALTLIYRHYQRADASQKQTFDTWCLSRFQGKLLWDAAGNVTMPLTEQAVSDIVDQWSAQVVVRRRSARSPAGTPESNRSPEIQPLLS